MRYNPSGLHPSCLCLLTSERRSIANHVHPQEDRGGNPTLHDHFRTMMIGRCRNHRGQKRKGIRHVDVCTNLL